MSCHGRYTLQQDSATRAYRHTTLRRESAEGLMRRGAHRWGGSPRAWGKGPNGSNEGYRKYSATRACRHNDPEGVRRGAHAQRGASLGAWGSCPDGSNEGYRIKEGPQRDAGSKKALKRGYSEGCGVCFPHERLFRTGERR